MYKKISILKANIIFNCLIVLALVLYPVNAKTIYIQNYIVDVCCILVIFILYTYYLCKNGYDIFDPIGIITFIYVFMFFVTPIYDIVIENYLWFGYELFRYGIKSSIIALIGYIAFFVFYSGEKSQVIERQSIKAVDKKVVYSKKTNKNIIFIILCLYAIAFAANVYYLVNSGYGNLIYILTMGILGNGGTGSESLSTIGFIAMFSYSLPTLVLLYWEYSQKPLITALLFIPMLMMQVARGFRFFIVQIAITFVAYFFITRRKRPKLYQIVIIFCILMVPIVLMTMFRDDVRSGAGVSVVGISMESLQKALDDAIWDNFRIYNNFYGLVHTVPSQYGFVYGRQIIIGTIVMMIPRAIWPNKISTKAGMDLSFIVGERLSKTGQSYPCIGEYYYAFGVLGVVFFMSIYGLWMRHVKNKYMAYEAGGLNNIVFSVLLGCNVQLIIRGYTPSNFWYIVFSLLPILLIRCVERTFETNR